MNSLVSEKLAQKGLIIILTLFCVLHILILLQVIPFEMVWGGRLTDVNQMRVFETVSLAVNMGMLAVVCIQAGYLQVRVSPVLVRVVLWLMFGIFLLNTIGNLLSDNSFERYAFTPFTLLMAVLCLKLARSKTVAA
ncbi:MAG: hypothetical protein LPJ89_11350 [Hymenobacteraceae bacterium]|nr:hypothetical protein [Hymenobacteraceae bacterium]MDX5395642.1 hypothetical protein [Hymenobacteraceae bacterium]MDX5444363.1 hypothetical protein [Hymenobacteraceae bacterium]MDX5511696.1 hypothetical protein [Hymenobacteraceae bacterium]